MRKIGSINGIPVVEGDPNKVKQNEIHYSQKNNGKEIKLAKRGSNNQLEQITEIPKEGVEYIYFNMSLTRSSTSVPGISSFLMAFLECSYGASIGFFGDYIGGDGFMKQGGAGVFGIVGNKGEITRASDGIFCICKQPSDNRFIQYLIPEMLAAGYPASISTFEDIKLIIEQIIIPSTSTEVTSVVMTELDKNSIVEGTNETVEEFFWKKLETILGNKE